MTDTTTPPTAAPPADPVRAALGDPTTRSRLTILAIHVHRMNPVDAEDAAQQVIMKLLEKCSSYDPTKCSVLGWACGYLVNICRELRRGNAKHQTYDSTANDVAAPPSPEDTASESRLLLDR